MIISSAPKTRMRFMHPPLHVMHLFRRKEKERERYYIVCKNIIKIYCPITLVGDIVDVESRHGPSPRIV